MATGLVPRACPRRKPARSDGVEENGRRSIPPMQSRDRGLIVPAPAEGSPSSDGNRAQDEDAPTRLAGSTSEEPEPGDQLSEELELRTDER